MKKNFLKKTFKKNKFLEYKRNIQGENMGGED